MSDAAPDLEASVRLHTADEGGRSKPIPSGFRCGWQLVDETQSDGLLRFADRDRLAPGDTAVQRILNPALEGTP